MERSAEAEWKGSISDGSGTIKLGSEAFEGRYSFETRFENEKGTNPEELIAAAHAGCLSMTLALGLGQAGFKPRRIHSNAKARVEWLDNGFKIAHIELGTDAEVPAIGHAKFREQAEAAKSGSPSGLGSVQTLLSGGTTRRVEESFRIETLHGRAHFVDPTSSLSMATVRARDFIIASGSRPASLPIPDADHLLPSDDFMEYPSRMTSVGRSP